MLRVLEGLEASPDEHARQHHPVESRSCVTPFSEPAISPFSTVQFTAARIGRVIDDQVGDLRELQVDETLERWGRGRALDDHIHGHEAGVAVNRAAARSDLVDRDRVVAAGGENVHRAVGIHGAGRRGSPLTSESVARPSFRSVSVKFVNCETPIGPNPLSSGSDPGSRSVALIAVVCVLASKMSVLIPVPPSSNERSMRREHRHDFVPRASVQRRAASTAVDVKVSVIWNVPPPEPRLTVMFDSPLKVMRGLAGSGLGSLKLATLVGVTLAFYRGSGSFVSVTVSVVEFVGSAMLIGIVKSTRVPVGRIGLPVASWTVGADWTVSSPSSMLLDCGCTVMVVGTRVPYT